MILFALFVLVLILIVIAAIASLVAMHTRFNALEDELAPPAPQRLTDIAIVLLAIASLLPIPLFLAHLMFPTGHFAALWIYSLAFLPVSAVLALLGKGPGRIPVLCGLGSIVAAACIGISFVRSSHFTLFESM